MNNVATVLTRIAVLAGGAALGALLARVTDKWLFTHAKVQEDDYHKSRYAQGLSPLAPEMPIEGYQGRQYQDYPSYEE